MQASRHIKLHGFSLSVRPFSVRPFSVRLSITFPSMSSICPWSGFVRPHNILGCTSPPSCSCPWIYPWSGVVRPPFIRKLWSRFCPCHGFVCGLNLSVPTQFWGCLDSVPSIPLLSVSWICPWSGVVRPPIIGKFWSTKCRVNI